MATMTARRLMTLSALLAALAACSGPTSRGVADQGVPSNDTRNFHNASYYIGADPSHPREKGGSGP